MQRFPRVIGVVFVLLLGSACKPERVWEPVTALPTPPPDNIQVTCTLELQRHLFSVVAVLRFVNQSEVAVPLEKWQLISDGELTSDGLFDVSRDGIKVSYLCDTVKRAPPSPEDIVMLEPGQMFRSETKLSRCYLFLWAGEYRVQYHTFVDTRTKLVEVNSNIATLTVK